MKHDVLKEVKREIREGVVYKHRSRLLVVDNSYYLVMSINKKKGMTMIYFGKNERTALRKLHPISTHEKAKRK